MVLKECKVNLVIKDQLGGQAIKDLLVLLDNLLVLLP